MLHKKITFYNSSLRSYSNSELNRMCSAAQLKCNIQKQLLMHAMTDYTSAVVAAGTCLSTVGPPRSRQSRPDDPLPPAPFYRSKIGPFSRSLQVFLQHKSYLKISHVWKCFKNHHYRGSILQISRFHTSDQQGICLQRCKCYLRTVKCQNFQV